MPNVSRRFIRINVRQVHLDPSVGYDVIIADDLIVLFVCLLSVQTTGKINFSFIETVFRIMTQVYFMRPPIKELL